MAERLTRSRLQGGASPTVIDPTAELLRLFSEARQDAIAVLQDCVDGRRKLSEACAKVRQASAQLLEMVREDLEYLEDPMGEGGGLAKPTTARLPQAQAGRALSLLVDACHLTMRAVLHHCEQGEQPLPSKHHPVKDAADAVGRNGDGCSGSPNAVIFDSAMGSAQLWRAAVSVTTALADATRLLAVPRFYSAFTIANPSCDGLLSVGELAAAVMRNAAAASKTATAAARAQQSGGRVQVKLEEEVLIPPDASCLLAAHASSLLLVACEAQPEGLLDALLRQPGGSERLHVIATSTLGLAAARIAETRYCTHDAVQSGITAGPLDPSPRLSLSSSSAFSFSYYFRQLQLVAMRFSELLADDGSYKAMAKQALLPALADALLSEPHRFVSWWGCGKDALLSGLSARDLLTAPQLTDRSPAAAAAAAAAAGSATGAPTSPSRTGAITTSSPGSPSAAQLLLQQQPPDCTSSHDDKLQTAAVGLLLKSPAARNNILPTLLACVRLPGGGSGLAAFGDCFLEERFICAGEGVEREELYVGGRGRGYKRRKILNPDAHGVNSEQVGAVLTAMATALEWAVLLCKMLSNASVDPPSAEAAEGPEAADGERAWGDAGGVKPSRLQAGDKDAEKDPIIGPPKAEGSGGAALTDTAAAARATSYSIVKLEPVGDLSEGAQDDSPRATRTASLANAFFNVLEARYSAGGSESVKREVAAAPDHGIVGAGPEDAALAMACRQVAHMARNLGMLLSLLLPVCPGGGEELRDSLRQLGYPSLRWPKMNVRLPVLVVDQDCELLQGLLEDLSSSASEVVRRQDEERRLRDSEAKRLQEREDRRRKRQEAEQKEAERRQRDKERRQKDRDRAKALNGDMAVGGELEGGEMALMSQEYGPGSGGDAMGAAAAGGAHQPRVRLVLRRGGPGGDGPGTANVAQLIGSPTVEVDLTARQQKRFRSSEEMDYDEEQDVQDDDGYDQTARDPVFAARLAAVGGPPGMPYGPNGMLGERAIESEEAAALLGLQVPRQRRSTRPMRPSTPTPPPEVLDQRVKACTVVPKATAIPGERRASAGVGLGGGPQGIAGAAVGGPGAGRRHPASLHLRTGPDGVVAFNGADEDDKHDAIIGPPPAAGGGGGSSGFPSAAHSHPSMSIPGAMPRHLQQQHQLPGPYVEGPSSLRQSPMGVSAGLPAHPSSHMLSGVSGNAAVTGQHPGQQQMIRQQQQQMAKQQQQMQQQEHPPAHSHSSQQQQQQYLPQQQQQQQHFSQYPAAQYPPQKQFQQQQYAQQQLLQQQQQQRMEAAGLAGGEAAGFRRAFPQYQQQQAHPHKPHGGGGGGSSGYMTTSADPAQAEQRQPSLDPYTRVQQQLQYQQQSYQQQYQ